MEKILLIGKGELFSSVVNYVFSNNSNDWITNFPYEQFLYLQAKLQSLSMVSRAKDGKYYSLKAV